MTSLIASSDGLSDGLLLPLMASIIATDGL